MNESNKTTQSYGLDEKPPLMTTVVYGLQWLAVSLPTIIIIGQTAASIHFSDPSTQVNYMQKLFFLMALTMLAQLFFGHRLPAVVGPASILLVGISSSQVASLDSIYTSVLIGGVLLSLICVTGIFSKIENLFNKKVVATILLLIALTLLPMIINLLFTVPAEGLEMFHFVFALILLLLMFTANRHLKGIWKSTLIIWTLLVSSVVYILLVPEYSWGTEGSLFVFSNFFAGLNFNFSLDLGVLISFLICFIALSINDLGTIQALGQLLAAPQMDKRLGAGLTVTGVFNIFAGFLGVMGPVNYALSSGVIATTSVASRLTLVPAGLAILIISFLPGVVSFLGGIPPLIIGVIFLYIMCSQVAAGLVTAFSEDDFTIEDGLTIGIPIMLGLTISFLPEAVQAALPHLLRPILSNGFVMGTLAVLIAEHLIFSRKKKASIAKGS